MLRDSGHLGCDEVLVGK